MFQLCTGITPCEEGRKGGTYDWRPCPDKYDILGTADHAGNPPAYDKPDVGIIVEVGVGDPANGYAPREACCGWWNLHATPNLQDPVLM